MQELCAYYGWDFQTVELIGYVVLTAFGMLYTLHVDRLK